MKQLILAVFMTTLGAVAAHADYAAIAAGAKGSSYVQGYASQEEARDAAVAKCRQTWGTSCSASTAEDATWFFAAGLCDGEPYTAASQGNETNVKEMLRSKCAADGRYKYRVFAIH
jgi:hypothetical protein